MSEPTQSKAFPSRDGGMVGSALVASCPVCDSDTGSGSGRTRAEFAAGESLRSLAIVVPMYRESKRIRQTVKTLAESDLHRDGIWFCFVDDGSPDETVDVTRSSILSFGLSNAEVVPLEANVGKGGAIRAGVLHVAPRSRYVGYLDADLSLDPEEVVSVFTEMSTTSVAVVVGDRVVDSARQPKLRRLASLVFRTLASSLVPTGVRDSQCAMKLFRSDVALQVFEPLETFGFAFDVEILGRLKRGGVAVVERPIGWEHQPGSQITTGSDGLRMLKDVLAIRGILRH